MKMFCLTFLMFVATVVLAEEPVGERKSVLPRLTQIDAFPESDRVAVRAMIAALTANGRKPSDYFAGISPDKEGRQVFYLKHRDHPAEMTDWRGDGCGHCLNAFYNTKTGGVRFQGIR